MPTYHFNIHRADEVLLDDVGEDLSDLQVAQNRAVEISCDFFREFPPREAAEAVAIEVQNDGSPVLRTLTTVRIEVVKGTPSDDGAQTPDVRRKQ